MIHEYEILQVENLDDFNIGITLENTVQNIQWRIQSKNYKELFIEVNNQTINGIGISWTNPVHPTAKYISIISRDFNPQLMEKLLEHVTPQNKVIFSCWEDENEKIRYINEFSFTLFRKTYMERYSIDYLLDRLQKMDETLPILSLQQVLANPLLEKDLFELLKHNYEQTHLDNEAKNVPWESWREMLLNDQPDFNFSYVGIEHSCINTYIFVHPVNRAHYEIGWIGKRNSGDLHAILKKQLGQLAANGVKTVEFEVDTTDYFAYEFAEILDLDNKKSWNSYILNDYITIDDALI